MNKILIYKNKNDNLDWNIYLTFVISKQNFTITSDYYYYVMNNDKYEYCIWLTDVKFYDKIIKWNKTLTRQNKILRVIND